MDRFDLGVVLSTVNIRSVTPPAEAADAFRDVASARADAARIVNEAEGYGNDILPRARGEAQQMLSASHGYRASKVQQAQVTQRDSSAWRTSTAETRKSRGADCSSKRWKRSFLAYARRSSTRRETST